MENQHKIIKGYRDLTIQEIDLMNRIKEFGPQLLELIGDLNAHLVAQRANAKVDFTELTRLDAADPIRWVDIGRENLQQGLMALTRSVAQPTFF